MSIYVSEMLNVAFKGLASNGDCEVQTDMY